MLNLVQSMNLAGENLLNSLCPTRHNLPTFYLEANRERKVGQVFHAPCHNLGRWWDAMLRTENATGFEIPIKIEAIMIGHLHRFFDNPDNLCFIPHDLTDIAPMFYPHSFRENILALSSVYYFRNNQWALRQAQRMLETIDRILKPDCSWDYGKLRYYNHCVNVLGPEIDYYEYRGRRGYIGDPNVGVDGRLIEGLAWCYGMTDLPIAMEIADRLSRFHLKHSTHPDGSLNSEIHPEHSHSFLNTMKGLLRFGVMTGQRQYVDAVAATFRVTVKGGMIKESGFISHDFMQDGISETASAADAAQIALWLGLNGYPEFFDDVERIVRSRIIPSQIIENPNLVLAEDDPSEDFANLNERFIGGYGCGIEHPNTANRVYTDVTSAVLHSVTDIYHNIVARSDAGLMVYLHFDYEDEDVRITSQRDQIASVRISPKFCENVLIRIPRWTSPESVELTVGGRPARVAMIGDFAFLSKEHLPNEIVLNYALPERTTMERTIGIDFTYVWRGDEIISVSPGDNFMPFYPPAEGSIGRVSGETDVATGVKRRDMI